MSSLSIGFESAGAIVELAGRCDGHEAAPERLDVQIRAAAQGIHARSDLPCDVSSMRAFASALAGLNRGLVDEARLISVGRRQSTILVTGQGVGQGTRLSVLGCLIDERIRFQIQDWPLAPEDLVRLRIWCERLVGSDRCIPLAGAHPSSGR